MTQRGLWWAVVIGMAGCGSCGSDPTNTADLGADLGATTDSGPDLGGASDTGVDLGGGSDTGVDLAVALVCGDTVIGPGETCDDGNVAAGDGCDASCQIEVPATCGNGTVDVGEACDLGAANDDQLTGACPSVCRATCRCPACGDSVTDFARGEQCDDGNTIPGDGCGASCAIEAAPSCGDGVLDLPAAEECDDGNTAAGDGCSAACQFEPVGQSCGNGTQEPLERCDDANVANGDGCNPTCNFTNTVTTLHTGIAGRGLAVDDDSIWLGTCNSATNTICAIDRIDVDACIGQGNCTPTRVAGGPCGAPVDGTTANAVLSCVETMTSDGAHVWFGNGHTIRMLDVAAGTISTVAGAPNRCGAVDGTGSAAGFHDLRALTYHAGQLYLLDACEHVLRRFDPTTLAVTTLAGARVPDANVAQTGPNAFQCAATSACGASSSMDGFALAATFNSPRYLTADGSGNLYVLDTNGNAMRSFNLTTGYVGTIVGGTGYTDGTGAAVRITRPRGIASDGTSVYWTEQTAHTVRQVEITSRRATTMVGVRGCPGMADGTGGDGSQDWSANCAGAPAGTARIDTPLGGFAFHGRTNSLLVLESGRLRRIR